MVILKFRQMPTMEFLTLFSMTWRNSIRKRWAVTTVAAAMCAVVPVGAVWADEPVDEPAPTVPADESVAAPETGEVDGAVVAVAAPPVPPTSEAPEVAVGLPPVPPTSEAPEVAVGLPPVPPTSEAPQVAVGKPPVPQAVTRPQVAVGKPPVPPAALFEQADAALDLLADLL